MPIGADRERNNGAISLRLNEAPRGKVLNFSGLEIAGRIGSAGGGAAAIFRRDRFLFQDLFFRGPGFSGVLKRPARGRFWSTFLPGHLGHLGHLSVLSGGSKGGRPWDKWDRTFLFLRECPFCPMSGLTLDTAEPAELRERKGAGLF